MKDELYKSIYTDEQLYHSIGTEGCTVIDVTMAMGGTEAVVESFYSVLKSQEQSGPPRKRYSFFKVCFTTYIITFLNCFVLQHTLEKCLITGVVRAVSNI